MNRAGFRQLDYLDHMIEALDLAMSYVDGMDKMAFLEDRRTQQAVIMNILVIGEAATRIVERYPEFAQQHPRIPWGSIRGMRNRLAHGYFDIDLDIVWETLRKDLPSLRVGLAEIARDAE
jgi:uncharacterized protein with HEPN domain